MHALQKHTLGKIYMRPLKIRMGILFICRHYSLYAFPSDNIFISKKKRNAILKIK